MLAWHAQRHFQVCWLIAAVLCESLPAPGQHLSHRASPRPLQREGCRTGCTDSIVGGEEGRIGGCGHDRQLVTANLTPNQKQGESCWVAQGG